MAYLKPPLFTRKLFNPLAMRLGLSGAGAIRTLGRLLIFPFSVLFLLMYAFVAHLRRAVNTSKL